MALFKYSPVDFFFTFLGLIFLLFDIALDILAVVSFYQEKAYVSLGFLLSFLIGSSVLIQVFSWLWYSYEDFRRVTAVEKCLNLSLFKLLHLFQLGSYIRHAGVMEMSVLSFFRKSDYDRGVVVYLSHDLSLLRLIETFSESCPQLVLMLTIILQEGRLDLVTMMKAVGSTSAIACSITLYHRALRSFLPDKENQKVSSSLVYFLFNLLLVSARVTALSLFASQLPCFILAHFICSWLVLFFSAWRCETTFMESAGGEWLYRATVGLIWYFTWFNVVNVKTKNKSLLYHIYQLVDIGLLCSLWCWKMNTEPSFFTIEPLNTFITLACVIGVYLLGIALKVIYYKCYHPNLSKEQLKGDSSKEDLQRIGSFSGDEVDFRCLSTGEFVPQTVIEDGDITVGVAFRGAPSQPPPPAAPEYCNKRMRKLAENFYS